MEKLAGREHDFSSKLRQGSVVQRLREYISWQRGLRANPGDHPPLRYGPISINLDLTLACNFRCPHCVDSTILGDGKSLRLEKLKEMIVLLRSRGLLSIILLGGGEPTLHRDFGEIVRFIKERGLGLGIVTNGSRLDRVLEIAAQLEENDWIRISIDAAREETFRNLHRPRTKVDLERVLTESKKIKERNPAVSLGYSFVIVWKGMQVNGSRLSPNTDEIPEAVELAQKHSFDYVSLKPCLIRLEDSQRESLLDGVDRKTEEEIAEDIRRHLQKAKEIANGNIKVLESVNLKAMLNKETERIKKQPKRCHMQFFRTVVTPLGIFHCPALRGVEKAKIGEGDGYSTDANFTECLKKTAQSISAFDAEAECKVVGCFYNETNWWLENLIESGTAIQEIGEVEDNNFFL